MKKGKYFLLTIIAVVLMVLSSCQLTTEKSNKLDTPNISISLGYVRWSKIDNADGYVISINNQEEKIEQAMYNLQNLTIGEYIIKVKAISNGEYEDSEYSNVLNYEVKKQPTEKLSTPVIILEEKVVTWDEVVNASDYEVYVNNNLATVTKELSYTINANNPGVYSIYVVAIDENNVFLNSNSSNVLTYVKEEEILKIDDVKQLIDLNPNKEVRVVFIGEVIGFDSLGYAHVADETGAIYVRAKNKNLALGNCVKITGYGFIYRGSGNYPEYTRQIKDSNITVELYSEKIVETKLPVILSADELSQYNSSNYLTALFMGNIVTIKGIVETGTTRYSFYLNDEFGNHLVAIHHYSLNFQNNIVDSELNVFLGLNGQEVTLTGIMYRYYLAEDIWTLQCIGLSNDVITNETKLLTPEVTLFDNIINWNPVQNATEYHIYVNNSYYDKTSEFQFDLSNLESGEYAIQVCAVDTTNNYERSYLSHKITYLKDIETGNVNIFMINDTHGSFIDGYTPGVERVSTLIKSLSSQNGDYIKIANGDIFQGSYVSSILYGLPFIDALNAMEFDAFIIGNHEFDWGLEEIHKYKDGNPNNGEANFPFVCANIYDKSTNKRVSWLEPYTIVEINGQRVGIIGLIGHTLESSILAANVKDYDFVYPLELVKEYANELRNDKDCDSVIVSIHDYDPDLNQQMASLSGNSRIDAILCGHTHTNVYETYTKSDSASIIVAQNRDKNQTATNIMLQLVNSNINTSKFERLYPGDYEKDPAMTSVVQKYQKTIDEGNRVLGSTNSTLYRETLGMYAVEAMKQEYQVDFSIMNTGGVRATIGYGEITVAEVFEVFPFNNRVYLIELTGRAVKSLYENNSNYLYISDNYNLSSIVDNNIYKIAVIDYVFTSGYYPEFEGVTYVDTNVIMRDIVTEYLDKIFD